MNVLQDKQVALVTGANRGIGYELVKQLASNGFRVILTSRDAEKGHEAVQKLKGLGLDVTLLVMDVEDKESISQAAATVNEQYGRLDVLINNAGVYLDENKKLLTMEPSIFEKTMTTNFFGAYHVIRSFISLMEKRNYGRIINISSSYGQMREMSLQGVGAYKLSKLALNGLTQLVATELHGDIKINAVDPGWVSTDMGGPSAPISPEQTAASILWLATIDSEGPQGGLFKGRERIDW